MEMLEEGKEYAVMLYTWRCCSRALPQVGLLKLILYFANAVEVGLIDHCFASIQNAHLVALFLRERSSSLRYCP